MTHKLDSTPNFPFIEKKWLKKWEKNKIQKKYLVKNGKSNKRFSFIDGPITANNPMGVHHAWGRSYKDLWQKFYNLLGYKQRFQNGFDCQGLWVEVEVEKQLKIKNKKEIENLVPNDHFASIAKFVNLCKQRVKKYAGIQTEQSKRLGYFMDWDNSYFTMSNENNYMIWHFLNECHKKKWLYKGKDAVPWCPRCETAISQHEMLTEDYKELVHETVFVVHPITTKGWKNTSIVIWTTTPWTVPGNIAAAINTKFTYGIWENQDTKDRLILILKDENNNIPTRNHKKGELAAFQYILERLENRYKGNYKLIKEIKGKDLIGLSYIGPFDDLLRVKEAKNKNPKLFHTIIDGSDIVVSNEGTGILHVATGAGKEDFDLGKKLNLPIINLINDRADYLKNMGKFSNKNAKKHPEIIINALKQKQQGRFLLRTMKYRHRYPACWRCKTELVWKVTDEWYIAMDKKDPLDKTKRTFRQQMIDSAKTIKWMPSFGLERELDWLNNMHDWLISKKNRYWGLALPIYECICGSVEVISGYEELKKRAVKGWEIFNGNSPHKPWIDAVKIKCSKCRRIISRIPDVGNPWLDAGIVPFSTLIDPKTKKPSYTSDKKYWKEWFPADFITESFPGQFKNWFYSLIAMSSALEKQAPFRRVLGFGTLLDEKGQPMHKSWGNMIEFHEGADKMGVDVIRWIYAKQDPKKNLLFGFKKAQETKRNFHLPLWNITKFFNTYINLDKWIMPKKISDEVLGEKQLSLLDKWIMAYLVYTVESVYRNLRNYRPQRASEKIELFVTKLSQWYIRLSRTRVWTNSSNNKDKDALYTTLAKVLHTLTIILSPYLPFFSEEIHERLNYDTKSVHLHNWPKLSKQWRDQKLLEDMEKVKRLAELGHAKRKQEKLKVRQVLASAIFNVPGDFMFNYNSNKRDYIAYLSLELNVKKITINYINDKNTAITLDSRLTPELKQEGLIRDAIRSIQQKRKELGCSITEYVHITIPENLKKHEKFIAQRVLANNVDYHNNNGVIVKKLKA